MAVQTGRTVSKYIRFILGDSSNVLREVGVNSIGEIGLTAEEVDLSAFQDAFEGFLSGQPGFELEFGGPHDTIAAAAVAASAAAPVLSGSHTVLQPIDRDTTPRSWGVYFGNRHYWETGEVTFGISRSATSGVWVSKYTLKPDGGGISYSARLRLFPGSTGMAWGTAAVT